MTPKEKRAMKWIVVLLLLGVLVLLVMDDPEQAVTTLLREVRSLIGN